MFPLDAVSGSSRRSIEYTAAQDIVVHGEVGKRVYIPQPRTLRQALALQGSEP